MPRYTGTRYLFGGSEGFLPSDLGGLVLWTQYDKGITVTGAGVSQWDDQSGEGNHLLQGTDTNRPSKESDGSILFDGVDNFLKATAFTLVQPETVYILVKQVTHTNLDHIYDGNASSALQFRQAVTSGHLVAWAGAVSITDTNSTVGVYENYTTVFNNTNSLIQVNNETATVGTVGTNDAGGFTLAAAGGGGSGWGNIQVKEVAIFNTAHDANTRAKVINYLMGIGQI